MINGDGSIKEIMCLYKLYESFDKGYFIENYKKHGIKMSIGTQTDIRLELGENSPSGHTNMFIRK